ncbi:MAG: tetratricopeptide repeat protein [Ignavibacteriaceae bacterium]|jgi:tetratricopeptide (TPR) repeat protein
MHHSKLFITLILLAGLAVTGFECASTELTSAKLYIQQKNYTKALESLQREVEKNPQSDEGYYLLGYVSGELGNFDTLVYAFNKSLAISKQFEKDIDASKKYYWAQSFNQGVGNFQKGSNSKDKDSAQIFFDKSIAAFKNAIAIEPDSADTFKNLAFVYMTEQKFDEAVEPLQTLIQKEKTIDGYRYLGEIYYDKAVKFRNQYGNTHNVNDSLSANEYYEKTINLAQEGRKLYPNDSELLILLSNSYIGAQKIDIAIGAFKIGVDQDPGNKYYRYNYGVLLLGNNDFREAEEQFIKAIEIDPAYQNAIYNLGVTYVKWGAKLAKENEDKKDNQDTVFMEKYRASLPYLERSLQLKPDDAAMWELVGRVYTVLGQQDKAQKAFDKADALRK